MSTVSLRDLTVEDNYAFVTRTSPRKRSLSRGAEQDGPVTKRMKEEPTYNQEADVWRIIHGVASRCGPLGINDSINLRNSLISPLLNLPPKIREKIFSFVVGHQFIHLQQTFRLIYPHLGRIFSSTFFFF